MSIHDSMYNQFLPTRGYEDLRLTPTKIREMARNRLESVASSDELAKWRENGLLFMNPTSDYFIGLFGGRFIDVPEPYVATFSSSDFVVAKPSAMINFKLQGAMALIRMSIALLHGQRMMEVFDGEYSLAGLLSSDVPQKFERLQVPSDVYQQAMIYAYEMIVPFERFQEMLETMSDEEIMDRLHIMPRTLKSMKVLHV